MVSGPFTSWDKAQDLCESWKANLVAIESDAENKFVLELMNLAGRPKAWIGMKAALDWYDYTISEYRNWASGEPDGQATNPCVWMYGTDGDESKGVWSADKCEVDPGIGVVCKKPSHR